ncbi:hypothetical protein JGI20_00852 [Candidatus Kryptobacter tengchongensis]|nr:hypothetical protein JGI20_00852 [Candidatus Kryptobacter tengchongensis]
MKKIFIYIVLFSLIISGCKKAVEPESGKQQKTVILNGQVLELTTNAPIPNAVVRVLGITPALIAILTQWENIGLILKLMLKPSFR